MVKPPKRTGGKQNPRVDRNENNNNRRGRRNNQYQNQQEFILPKPKRPLMVIPKNLAQETFLDLLEDESKTYVIGHGSAGTGKSLLAIVVALQALMDGKIKKIYITKPFVLVGTATKSLGAMPGDLIEKTRIYLQNYWDIFEMFFNEKDIENMIKNKIVEILPLELMRGRNMGDGINNVIVIADEMANSDVMTVKTLLTRLNTGSRLFLLGDKLQSDIKGINGLSDLLNRLDKAPKNNAFASFQFIASDSVRSPLMTYILRDLYEET